MRSDALSLMYAVRPQLRLADDILSHVEELAQPLAGDVRSEGAVVKLQRLVLEGHDLYI